MFLGSRARPVRRADHTGLCKPPVQTMWDPQHPTALHSLLTGIALLYGTECASCEVRAGLQVLQQVASISLLTVSRLSRQCGILNILQHYRPPRPVTWIALLYGDGVCFL
jgi:hypothetical protein